MQYNSTPHAPPPKMIKSYLSYSKLLKSVLNASILVILNLFGNLIKKSLGSNAINKILYFLFLNDFFDLVL